MNQIVLALPGGSAQIQVSRVDDAVEALVVIRHEVIPIPCSTPGKAI